MPQRTCTFTECEGRHLARGFCAKHYQRYMKFGDPSVVLPPKGPAPVDPWTRIEQRGPDECWPWTHSTDPDGYGVQKIAGKRWRVARWVLTQKVGPLQPDEVTRHTCDNPICCNPNHLLRGYPVDNARDMVSRHRQNRGSDHWTVRNPEGVQGENNSAAKLTVQQVSEIRRRYATGGVTQVALAEQFGVDQAHISSIVRRKAWAHVP